jgi:hypothetical protein
MHRERYELSDLAMVCILSPRWFGVGAGPATQGRGARADHWKNPMDSSRSEDIGSVSSFLLRGHALIVHPRFFLSIGDHHEVCNEASNPVAHNRTSRSGPDRA